MVLVRMIHKNMIIYIVLIIIAIYVITNISINLSPKKEDRKIFPGILGDTILKSNETGISSIMDMVSYDDFQGDIISGYKANYTNNNGTMIIFIAHMSSNESAYRSLKDMALRIGYNESLYNESLYNESLDNESITDNSTISITVDDNTTIIRLPVKNPELFLIKRDKNKIWHYAFSREDKVYWVGFNNLDMQYHIDMMIEVYKNVGINV